MEIQSKYSLGEIVEFIIDETGCAKDEITLQSDMTNDLGCSGDDFHELMEAFTRKFNVDMTNYLWYFHTDEEGHSNSIGRIFSKAPYERALHMPVTPVLLLECANQGKWLVVYPEHSLPKRRYDILINRIFFVLVTIFLIYRCAS